MSEIVAKSRAWAAGLVAWLRAPGAWQPRGSSRLPWLVFALVLLFGAGHTLFLRLYVPSVDQGLESIKENGKLVVLTRLGPTTWYEGVEGLTGFEYEAMLALGRSLGVEVEFRIYSTEQRLVRALAVGKGHVAAAGLAFDEDRKAAFAAGPAYATTRQLVVCNRQLVEKPGKIEDLAALRFAAAAGSPGAAALAEGGLRNFQVAENTETLLSRVAARRLDCALSDARILQIVNPYYPELMQAFELTGDFPVAWLVAPGSEDLVDPLRHWFAGMKKSGRFAALERRFFGFLPRFDYVDLRAFQQAVQDRLPLYEKQIRRAARENNLSWQLLAAVGYQESHWDPEARSPTGVRGFMMLTKPTAKRLGVEDRLDAAASIAAGARYLADLKERMPEEVAEPDRTYIALAAWNVGLGHVLDARALAERQGRDKNSWADLRRVLPQLANPGNNLRHGTARGGQAVHFVQQVRTYLHILQGDTGT
ncbi:membrane-bound lytic murein transglycosylase MltF [Parvibaculum sp.]|uniref:membrane-bound lytic murein transglycosylase MltF n=1 Tax=Parvibaculum sp. TaxID=2024848 RepID=UPI0034A07C2A